MVITDQNQRFFPCFTPTTQSIQQSKDFFFHQTANRELDNVMKDAFCTIHKEKMKSFCKEALSYGEMTQHLTTKPYHVTVILNPAAQGGKARTKFEKFCEPLLHLAGYKV